LRAGRPEAVFVYFEVDFLSASGAFAPAWKDSISWSFGGALDLPPAFWLPGEQTSGVLQLKVRFEANLAVIFYRVLTHEIRKRDC
jgi:hypothetical protein